MKDYFFKYIVPAQIERVFHRFKPALQFATKTGEKVYLTSFSKFNSYNEPYSEQIITSVKDIAPARNKLIKEFYQLTETQPMSRKDYTLAYKFLQIRKTESGQVAPFRITTNLPEKQQERIFKFLIYNHQVKFF
ncbi:MAG: hypothetical protein HQ522_06465 [Bacteroidetes bacterium]|nr:hypothetical protein [Bacteroidota bacterium]